jgi:hypothetical protein
MIEGITGISGKTNLLALNVAMEVAGAREHGQFKTVFCKMTKILLNFDRIRHMTRKTSLVCRFGKFFSTQH